MRRPWGRPSERAASRLEGARRINFVFFSTFVFVDDGAGGACVSHRGRLSGCTLLRPSSA